MSQARAYRPEIDGLRAIAVTAVILYHGQIAPLPGGFAGVDVFFVISGFLIGGILTEELAQGRFSILRFYERRVRRIVPALIAVLACTSAAMVLLSDPTQLFAYSQSLGALLLMVSNLFFGAKSGYFAPALADAPLLHTWSLAVEEQFYLAFPLALALIWRLARRRVLVVLAVLALISLVLAEVGWRLDADVAYFNPLTRAWELLLGAIAAEITRRHDPAGNPWAAGLGLAMIAAAFLFQSEATAYPSWPALLPTAGAALVLLFARAGQGAGRMLAARPFVAVGLISYSAYLWHQPLFALARIAQTDPPGWAEMAGLGLLAFVLAWATWAFVEQPFRRREHRWLPRARPLLLAAALAVLALSLTAGWGWQSRGNYAAWSRSHPDQAAMLDLIAQAAVGEGLPPDAGPCRFNLTRIDAAARARIATCAAQNGPAAVVLGDSHAIDVFSALLRVSPAPFLLGVTDGGCRLADANPKCAYGDFAALVAASPQDFAQILYVQAGAYLLLGPDGRPTSRQIFRHLGAKDPVPPLTPNLEALGQLTAYLGGLATHVPVTVLAPRIEPQVPPNLLLRQGCRGNFALRPGLVQTFMTLDAALSQRLQGTRILYVPLDAQAFDMRTDFMTCTTLYWSDGDHWSASGEARFGTRLLPLLPAAFR